MLRTLIPLLLLSLPLQAQEIDRVWLNAVLQKTTQNVEQVQCNQSENTKANSNGLFVFVSLSMPKTSLEQLMRDAKKAGVTLVLRGLKNNSFRETLSELQPLVENSQGGLMINPQLFDQYQIKKVPTFVYQFDDVADSISGDVSLTYAVNRIASRGEADKALIHKIQSRLRSRE